jgi:hypothetical protein
VQGFCKTATARRPPAFPPRWVPGILEVVPGPVAVSPAPNLVCLVGELVADLLRPKSEILEYHLEVGGRRLASTRRRARTHHDREATRPVDYAFGAFMPGCNQGKGEVVTDLLILVDREFDGLEALLFTTFAEVPPRAVRRHLLVAGELADSLVDATAQSRATRTGTLAL